MWSVGFLRLIWPGNNFSWSISPWLIELVFVGYSLGDIGLSAEFPANLFQKNNSRHSVIFNIDVVMKIEIG